MSIDIVAPAAGESVTEVEISNWKVKDGDSVAKDQVIAEVETEKASLEVRSPISGKISIIIKAGTVVKPGEKVAVVTESGGGESNPSQSKANSAKASTPSTPVEELAAKPTVAKSIPTTTLNANPGNDVAIVVPNFGESVQEGEIATWMVKDGEVVSKDQMLLQIESDKATLDIMAPSAGTLNIEVPSGKVTVGQNIGKIKVGEGGVSPTANLLGPAETSSSVSPVATKSAVSFSGSKIDLNVYASPSVRKVLLENNVDIKDFLTKNSATSEGGKTISAEEVKNYLAQRTSSESQPSGDSAASKTLAPSQIGSRKSETKKMTRLRQTIAKRLVNAQQTSALLTTFNEIDMGEVMAIRSQYKELFKKKHEVGLGFMSFFVKAVCQALLEFPVVNSMIDNDNIVENHYVDMGIAVATPKGLVVPVIRNAEALSFKAIEEVILGFGKKGKEGTISMDDLVGGTFTITNGGTFGSMLSTPIINYPQSAILGMHNIVQRPVVKDGEIVIRPVMYVALTYDHRIIDGADSVRFLYRIKEFIEDPHRLLVGV